MMSMPIADDSPEAIRRKRQLFEQSQADPAWRRQKQACDLWTAAFFQPLTPGMDVITTAALAEHLAGRPIDPRVTSLRRGNCCPPTVLPLAPGIP